MTPAELALQRLSGTPLAPLAPVSIAQAVPEAEGVATYTVPVRQEPSFDEMAARARDAGFGVDLARAGAMVNEAITGAAAPTQAYDELAARAQAPVRMVDARQKAEYEAALRDPFSPESQRRRAALERANPDLARSIGAGPGTSWTDMEAINKVTPAATQPGARKPVASTDPHSPESQRAQALAKSIFPAATPEELSQVTEANAGDFLKYKSMSAARGLAAKGQEASLEARAAEREQRGEQFAQTMGFNWAKLDREQQMRMMEFMDKQAEREAKAQEKKDALVVPGADVAPDARPTPMDAETVKKVLVSEGRMRNGIARMRALHTKYGTEKGGKGGMWLTQAMTGLRLEAKNIADLGALSGPDQGLMESLAGDDPTTAWANVKAFFGQDNTEAALQGLEEWMSGQVSATLEARGYRRKTHPPARVPATQALPKDASGQPTLDERAGAPRIVNVKGMKPGELLNSLKDGETVRVPMGGGKYQVVRRQGSKLIKVKE